LRIILIDYIHISYSYRFFTEFFNNFRFINGEQTKDSFLASFEGELNDLRFVKCISAIVQLLTRDMGNQYRH